MSQPKNQPPTWRTYLGQLIDVPAEKQRAARELNVSPLTLTRWVIGATEPRPGSLKKLPSIFPGHEQRLAELIRAAYDPGGASVALPGAMFRKAIPPEFSASVLSVLARTAGPIVTSSVCNLVLRQAVDQLDPDFRGMEIIVAQCTPPTSGLPVRSLFARIGAGTLPWTKGVSRRLLFCGAESLAGYVAGMGEPGVIQNMEQVQGPFPIRPDTRVKSAVAYPLLRRGRIAGCVLVNSSQIEFFTPERTDLVEQYANLLSLAYYDEQFYRPKEIMLEILPSPAEQKLYLASFRQQVLEYRRTSQLDEAAAELRAVQEIEARFLLHMNSSQGSDKSRCEPHM